MEPILTYSTASPHPAEQGLPTLPKLGNPVIPDDVDAQKIASAWVENFAKAAETVDVNGVLDLFVNSSFESDLFLPEGTAKDPVSDGAIPVLWRDLLAFTWDFRTLIGTPAIQKFLQHRLQEVEVSNVQLKTDNSGTALAPSLDKPYPDLTWIQLFFSFETKVGMGMAIARLVPLSRSLDRSETSPSNLITGDVIWKAHVLLTNLEDLKGFPESLGARRNHLSNHGKWESERRKEVAFEDREPTVLIIGAGQSGLEVGARLKALGVDALIVDKNEKVGDNWRSRYEALCLHDPVCESTQLLSGR